MKGVAPSSSSSIKCAIILLFLGGAFYLRIEADRRREFFQREGDSSADLFFDRIDVNHAGSAALEALPGIGKFLANEMIKYRCKHGLFKKPSDLLNVKGIGPKRLKQISPYLIFSSPRGNQEKKKGPCE